MFHYGGGKMSLLRELRCRRSFLIPTAILFHSRTSTFKSAQPREAILPSAPPVPSAYSPGRPDLGFFSDPLDSRGSRRGDARRDRKPCSKRRTPRNVGTQSPITRAVSQFPWGAIDRRPRPIPLSANRRR